MTNFVVVGFPKCGTSALIRMLGTLDGVVVERNGADLEAPFYMTKAACDAYEASRSADPTRIYGHKHAPYIYQPSAIQRLAVRNPGVVFIVCVRDPLKSLASWREMHRSIAIRGTPTAHIVNRDPERRKFFIEASLAEYYREWARERLQYARHLRSLEALIEGHPLAIVEQAAMAADPDLVLDQLAQAIGAPPPPPRPSAAKPHVGQADRNPPKLDDDNIRAELDGERAALDALLDELRSTDRAIVIRPRSAEGRARIGAGQLPSGMA